MLTSKDGACTPYKCSVFSIRVRLCPLVIHDYQFGNRRAVLFCIFSPLPKARLNNNTENSDDSFRRLIFILDANADGLFIALLACVYETPTVVWIDVETVLSSMA